MWKPCLNMLAAHVLGALVAFLGMAVLFMAGYALSAALTSPPGPLQLGATLLVALTLRPAAPEPEPVRPDGCLDFPAMLAYALYLSRAPRPVAVLDYDELLLCSLLAEVVA
jgi:hypothetical protein